MAVPVRAICGLLVLVMSTTAFGLDFGPAQSIQANGVDVSVGRFAMPIFDDWNSDGLKDLIIGEGVFDSPFSYGQVRVYLNQGVAGAPVFGSSFYAQTGSGPVRVPADGCVTAGPRLVDWNNDSRKDLLVSRSDGLVSLYLNTNTDADPIFDDGSFVQVGPSGSKLPWDVGARSVADVTDWNNDGLWDLMIGSHGGRIEVSINEGTPGAPDFVTKSFVQEGATDLHVDGNGRSAPSVADWDDDGDNDVLSGNGDGELIFYPNKGTNEAPLLDGHSLATSQGTVIDFDVDAFTITRSRPFACDWNEDGFLDVLMGVGDATTGQVLLYTGVPEPTCLALLAAGGIAILRRRNSNRRNN